VSLLLNPTVRLAFLFNCHPYKGIITRSAFACKKDRLMNIVFLSKSCPFVSYVNASAGLFFFLKCTGIEVCSCPYF